MSYKVEEPLVMENARLMFRNFSGKETKYNREGNRNFAVVIDDSKVAEKLNNDGWNIRTLAPLDPDDEPTYVLSVTVSFRNIPPKIYMVTGHNKTLLNEMTVGELDYAEIKSCDMIIRPYNWEVNGKTGVKAYVKDMYVNVVEDIFASKYDFEDTDVPF